MTSTPRNDKKMKSTPKNHLPKGGHPNGQKDGHLVQFGCTARELSELIELSRQEANCRIRDKYGSIDEICRRLHTSSKKGLSGSVMDLQMRREVFGSNAAVVPAPGTPSMNFLCLLWNAAWDITLAILIAAIVISYALSFLWGDSSSQTETSVVESSYGWVEYVVLVFLILVLMLAFALVEWYKQRWFCSASGDAGSVLKCATLRRGEVLEIPSKELVVGDICPVKYGDIIPACGLLIHGNSLRVKEKLPSGAVHHVIKDVFRDPILLSGVHVVDGSGKMVVTKVGPTEEFSSNLLSASRPNGTEKHGTIKDVLHRRVQNGKSSDVDQSDLSTTMQHRRKSTLEAKIKMLTIRLSYIGVASALLTVAILLTRLSLMTFAAEKRMSVVIFVQNFMGCLLLGSAVLVMVVPTRLPMTLTLAFAQAIKRLMPNCEVVRCLEAIENTSYVTDIITNKTGTLSTNKMTIDQFYLAGRIYKDLPAFEDLPADARSILIKLIAVDTEYMSQAMHPDAELRCAGNGTDCALLKFVLDLGHSYEAVRELVPEDCFVKVYPFNSTRKSMSRVIPYDGGGYQLLTKGAAELILRKCAWIHDSDGNISPLLREDVEKFIQNIIQPMASVGLATVCLAYKNYVCETPQKNEELSCPESNWEDEENVIANLTCVAIFGIRDELRDEVPEAVEQCKKLGITVRLATGGGADDARVTALKCGILKPQDDSLILQGTEFESRIRQTPRGPVVPELFDEVWPRLRILVRASPQNKHNLIRGIVDSSLWSHHLVTAFVGKDLQDVPSLKTADVGFSMETVGSQVANEASDIVLKNNSFADIVKVVICGRNIQDTLRRLLQFQLAMIVVTFFTVFFGVCMLGESPLKSVHLLWMKIMLDVLAPLAFTSEPPTDDFLDCKPYTRAETLFSRSVGKNIIGHSIYQLAVVLTLIFAGEALFDMDSEQDEPLKPRPSQLSTVIFNTCVVMMLFNQINSRVLLQQRNVFDGMLRNFIFMGIWIGNFVVQVLIVQFGRVFFSTVALTLEQWGWCLLFGVGELLWGQIIISIPTCGPRKNLKFRRDDVQQMELVTKPEYGLDYDDLLDDSPLGLMLWRHGLTRLQHQLRVARAFRSILEDSEFPSSQGSLSNHCSWPVLDEIRIDSGNGPNKQQSLSAQNCSFHPLRQASLENHCPQRTLSFKSQSADNVLFNLNS